MYTPDDPKTVEKYSSAVTLSDMEIFIFPELMYSLMLANLMSPLLWQMREDPWFRKMHRMNRYRKVQRTKQFIMDNFVFNLDLDTWGLTTKDRELERFSGYIDAETLSQSNALFGYEGDKYYFDLDIRRHFGLDTYTSDCIPYWKTETIEAMTAFKYKKGYPSGAGECVSLAALYAAALHVLAEVPLEDIYMIATPLHSQNFIDVKEGIITNNRRIVTKNMWFNGTELSAKARRALQNERVTMVVNNTGYIHTMYPEATMSQDAYRTFSRKIRSYLKTDINFTTLASFLRQNPRIQNCFQMVHSCCGKPRFIEAEKVFHYEHNSKSRVGDETQTGLLHQIDEDEYYPSPIENRIILDEIEAFFNEHHISIDDPDKVEKLKKYLHHGCYNVEEVIRDLTAFAKIEPRLPSCNKNWLTPDPISLGAVDSPEDVIAAVESLRSTHEVADLAFSAYRDMSRAPWKPFLKAAFERNPVCTSATQSHALPDIVDELFAFENESIYNGTRLSQPDEVWNFRRGDGVEKAITLAAIIHARHPESPVAIEIENGRARVTREGIAEYSFETKKEVPSPALSDFSFLPAYKQ